MNPPDKPVSQNDKPKSRMTSFDGTRNIVINSELGSIGKQGSFKFVIFCSLNVLVLLYTVLIKRLVVRN